MTLLNHSSYFAIMETYNEEWKRLRRWAATCVAMYAAYVAILVSVYHRSNYLERSISNEGDYE